MTETQAQSGTTTSTSPEEATAVDGVDAAPAGGTVVGRASVPADAIPRYTRPEGMTPPPLVPTEVNPEATEPYPAGGYSGSATVRTPVSGSARVGAGTRTAPTRPTATSRVGEVARAARATVSGAAARGPRRARLFVKRIDPWSVMKFSFAVSFVLFFVAIVATSVLYLALDAMGVFDSVNSAFADIVGASGGKSGSFKITAFGVIGTAGVIGLVNVVLFTALATLGAFIYNVCADLVGGIEVTLSEKD